MVSKVGCQISSKPPLAVTSLLMLMLLNLLLTNSSLGICQLCCIDGFLVLFLHNLVPDCLSISQFQDAKARAERRLEPWVRRELQAVMPNSDHAFLVRLVLGLWFGAEYKSIHVAERQGRTSGPGTISTRDNGTGSTEVEGTGGKAMKELKRFLGDKAELFWHELR